MQRRFFLFAAVAVSTALTTFVTFVKSSSLSRRPFTISSEIDYYKDGAPFEQMRSRVVSHYRADGASSTETRWLAQGDRAPIQEIVEPLARRVTIIDHYAKVYYSAEISSASAARRSAPVVNSCEKMYGTPCSKSEPLLGVTTFLLEIDPPGSGHRTKLWVSPDLAWARIREEHRDTTGQLLSTVVATNLVFGEPVPSQFSVPADYRNASGASEFAALSSGARGHIVSTEVLNGIKERSVLQDRSIAAENGPIARFKAWVSERFSR